MNAVEKCNFAELKSANMIWITLIILLVVLLLYTLGSFVPHSTNTCLISVDREIEQCFAMANSVDHFAAQLHDVDRVILENEKITGKGNSGIIYLHGKAYPFKVVDFIPNYRVALQHQSKDESWTLQLSFYRESRKQTRLVLIATVTSNSNFRRVCNAWRKPKRELKFNRILSTAKTIFERDDEVVAVYEDVSPEENPNFSLR